jgi:hypothetical protein
MWVKKEFPLIPGYDSLGDNVAAKFWIDQLLSQWLDTADPVTEFRDKLSTREDLCDFIIAAFEYPLVRGIPVDKHSNNWFSGMECYTITQDYWQPCSETLRTLKLSQRKEGTGGKGTGDCEDTSLCFTTLFLEKGWQVWQCLGEVYQGDVFLGGHGWAVFEDDDGIYRLYESTLSEVPQYPNGYPAVDPDSNDWQIGGIRYHAYVKFNRHEYFEWETGLLTAYLRMPRRLKETRRKYRVMQAAWTTRIKPLEKAGLLSRIRWR